MQYTLLSFGRHGESWPNFAGSFHSTPPRGNYWSKLWYHHDPEVTPLGVEQVTNAEEGIPSGPFTAGLVLLLDMSVTTRSGPMRPIHRHPTYPIPTGGRSKSLLKVDDADIRLDFRRCSCIVQGHQGVVPVLSHLVRELLIPDSRETRSFRERHFILWTSFNPTPNTQNSFSTSPSTPIAVTAAPAPAPWTISGRTG